MTTTDTDPRVAAEAMRRLDGWLGARPVPEKVGLTILDNDREEAAAIARRRGYELHLTDVEEPGCVWAEFWPA
ncbi:hypothetical protein Acsp06_49860 [Actinomycetospora sp. NBRC 106375]|uniref:hypothetical protein n=1 Tax=Actinomycetospora sp. NBRC 106375 TaxID=3032207 RepID=UPI0024A0C43E|nr:hypothetical protein [Actinomycetospora sp. NBRC 106375]GLZ48801.1 hypothetical protein Acsp06_49860 [Actinomycetospora sp. NBRC 106375]